MPKHPIPSGSLSSDPMPSDPMSRDPMSSDPISSDPMPSDPMPSDPLPSDPLPSDPMSCYSISSDPTPSDPILSNTMAGDSLPIDSITSDPMPSGSLPSEPMANQPAPSYPVAPESVTPESFTSESVISESLPSEPIPDPAASANIPFAEKASAADNFSDPSDNLAAADNPEDEPASEEIATPIAALPENQDPAPAQTIDLRQMADQPPQLLTPDLPALAEPSPPLQRQIPIATAAPLVATEEPKATKTQSATAAGSNGATALPLQLINQLLRKIGATPLVSLGDMLPLLRILTLAVLAGIALRIANATLGAIDDLPLVGGLLELVGLVTLLNFLARNAFKQKKRAELLARIQKLRTDLLG